MIFLLCLISAYIITCICLTEDAPICAIIAIIGSIVGMYFLPAPNNYIETLLLSIIDHPFYSLLGVAVYVLLGFVNSFIRWIPFVKEKLEHYPNTYKDRMPNVKEYINHVTKWVIFWVFDLGNNILTNVIKKTYKKAIIGLSGIYTKIAEKAIKRNITVD